MALSATQSDGLRSLIRHRFKTDRLLQSSSRIANGLHAGHEILGILCAAAQGETKSIDRLSALLESTLKLSESTEAYSNILHSARTPTSLRAAPEAKEVNSSGENPSQSSRTKSRPVLERPLPLSEIRSGKRRVPEFVDLQGIPFLRYSKPQSSSLGRVLRQKVAWQTKKWDQRNKLTEEIMPLGEVEDGWDTLVAMQKKQEGVPEERPVYEGSRVVQGPNLQSWNSAIRLTEAGIAQDLKVFDRKNLDLGRRMFEIMKKERELAAKEKADIESTKREPRV